jgi:hypothetical protein
LLSLKEKVPAADYGSRPDSNLPSFRSRGRFKRKAHAWTPLGRKRGVPVVCAGTRIEGDEMVVERDNYGEFHVRGTRDDGEPGWSIKVWLKSSNRDGPEDHEYRVVNGNLAARWINRRRRLSWLSLNSGKKDFP